MLTSHLSTELRKEMPFQCSVNDARNHQSTVMPKLTTYKDPLVIALATTGPDPYRDKITEITSVAYENGEKTDSFQRNMRTDSSDPASILQDFSDYLTDHSFFLAHDAELVKSFLRRATKERVKISILDTRELARICFPSLPTYELGDLCDHLELLPLEGAPITSLCDHTMLLWTELDRRLRELPPELLSEIAQLYPRRTHPLHGLLRMVLAHQAKEGNLPDGGINDLFRKERLPKRRELPPGPKEPLDTEEIAKIFGPNGRFAEKIEGYEYRAQQMEMAKAVASSFNESKHLFIEAGTGVGKSLAYLAPAALWASVNDMPVVVSTNTKNLQAQLLENDVPRLLEILGLTVDAVVIKGRNNYVCVRKLCYLLKHADFELSRKEIASLACVAAWATSTNSGDIAECAACSTSTRDAIGHLVTSEASECQGMHCRHRQQCFLFRARRKAKAADIVIANHAVVFREMEEEDGSPVLPPYRHLIFDEAHNLEDAATSWLSTEISTSRLYYLLGRLWRRGRRRSGSGLVAAISHSIDKCTTDAEASAQAAQHIEAIVFAIGSIGPTADAFFDSLAALLVPNSGKDCIRVKANTKRDAQWQPITESKTELIAVLAATVRAAEALMVLLQQTDGGSTETADFIQDLEGAIDRISTFIEDIDFVLAADSEDYVYWVEELKTRQGGIRAFSAPIRISTMLRDHIYTKKHAVVMTSATLSVGGSLGFMKKRLGLDLIEAERLVEHIAGTPFDYRSQCLVMVPLFLPDPGDPSGDYAAQLGILLSEVFRRTRGRGMSLFTSYKMLRTTSAVLRDEMIHDDVQILTQGESGSRENIIKIFKKNMASVLMGTHSFWEGVDVVGESLSCLAVTRLPFAVFTDPIVQARCEQIEEEGRGAFMGFSVPNAIIRFRQGFGRLIRHRTDRGIVIVTDRRLVAKRYGHWFQKSIPSPTVTFRDRDEFLDAVADFMSFADD